MSLINEALKEARHDATRTGQRKGDSLYPRVPRHGPRRHRLPFAWLAGLALVVVISVAAGTAWLVTRGDRPPTAEPSSPVSTSTAGPPPSDATGETATGDAPATATDLEGPAPTTTDDATVTEAVTAPLEAPVAESAPSPEVGETVGPAAVDQPLPPPAARPSRPPVAQPAPEEVQEAAPPIESGAESAPAADESSAIYRREARLEDGTRLTLEGIAWSPTQPVALLNGRVIGVGERVQGFTLRQVYPREVHLARGDRIVILTTE